MNVEAAWKLVALALSLTCCTLAWLSCALSGGDLLECVVRGLLFFAVVWVALMVLGATLRAVLNSGGQE